MESFISFFWKCHAKFISIFPTLKNLIFSFPIFPLQRDMNKMYGSHFKIWRSYYNYLTQGD